MLYVLYKIQVFVEFEDRVDCTLLDRRWVKRIDVVRRENAEVAFRRTDGLIEMNLIRKDESGLTCVKREIILVDRDFSQSFVAIKELKAVMKMGGKR